MKFQLFSTVLLAHDLPQMGFCKGDVGTVVEYISSTDSTPEGYIVEFFDNEGQTIDVIPVLESELIYPHSRMVVNYRDLENVA
ncbi:DUF4926 domain-containing protein [Runella limosa]|jgi:hypothetical protein|uniref:DUF4926 domain-containing protein n=1 Tax=Runella limosa TaxID=370978 RepID=UPI000412129D|nr:DUF4926 domain-containing protein [Runella limosa]MCA0232588.1 DUF4926 domain-containing protein [Bacteroidota bacterium]